MLHTVYVDLHAPVEVLFNRRSILAPTNANHDAINDAASRHAPRQGARPAQTAAAL